MSGSRPTISAVIILFDGRSFLPDLFRTLIDDLSGFSHEIIVVDNGSTDESVSFIRENCPTIELIENGSNLGFAPAVNIGLSQATGDYLFILNQDLRIRPGCTPNLLQRLQQDDRIGLIGPKFVGFDGTLQHSIRGFPRCRDVWYRLFLLDRIFPSSKEFGHWRMTWFDHQSELLCDQPMGAAMLVPRSVYEEVGPMDERFPLLFNDVDWCRRIADAGYRLLYHPEAAVEHFVGASTGQIPYRLIVESHRSMYRYLKKHARPSGYPIVCITGLVLYLTILPKMAARFLRRLIISAAPSS